MAGFMFQLQRGLIRLAQGKRDSLIGIETLDDVVFENSDGSKTVEQNKLSFRRNPIPDSSPNFWNTLATWIGLLEGHEIKLDTTEFCLVSTFEVGNGIAKKLTHEKGSRDNEAIAAELLKLAKAPKPTFTTAAKVVKKLSNLQLTELVTKITVVDTTCQDTKTELAERLHLPPEIQDDVLHGLTGWLFDEVMYHFERIARSSEDKAANWIKTSDFNRELAKLIARHHNNQFILRASQEIVADEEGIAKSQGARFVHQLQILDYGTSEGDKVSDAIVNFLKAESETTRLAAKSEVTQSKFVDFEEQLVSHWRRVWSTRNRSPLPTDELTGQQILDDSLAARPQLDNQAVTQDYFIEGTYHALANRSHGARVGWHPQFEARLGGAA